MIGSPGMWDGERWFAKGKVGCEHQEKGEQSTGQQKEQMPPQKPLAFYDMLRYWKRYIFFFETIFTILTLGRKRIAA